jgi:hypothetical protein
MATKFKSEMSSTLLGHSTLESVTLSVNAPKDQLHIFLSSM